jgi:hypothetical protein
VKLLNTLKFKSCDGWYDSKYLYQKDPDEAVAEQYVQGVIPTYPDSFLSIEIVFLWYFNTLIEENPQI